MVVTGLNCTGFWGISGGKKCPDTTWVLRLFYVWMDIKRYIFILKHVDICISSFFLCMFSWNQPASALLLHAPTLFLAQGECTSVETGQLFHQYFRALVVTAEVLERCKVQRGSVWRRLGDPSHVLLLMLSRGEVDTQPTGVTVPLPNWLSQYETGAEMWVCWSPHHQLILCLSGLLTYFATSCSYWPSTWLQHITPTLMERQKLTHTPQFFKFNLN